MNSELLVREAKRALRSFIPAPLLLRREMQYYARYGEIELHLVPILCRPDQDAIDVGAHDGCYIHFMRKHSRTVHAFEPIPWLVQSLARRFTHSDVIIHEMALSRVAGTATLHLPL